MWQPGLKGFAFIFACRALALQTLVLYSGLLRKHTKKQHRFFVWFVHTGPYRCRIDLLIFINLETTLILLHLLPVLSRWTWNIWPTTVVKRILIRITCLGLSNCLEGDIFSTLIMILYTWSSWRSEWEFNLNHQTVQIRFSFEGKINLMWAQQWVGNYLTIDFSEPSIMKREKKLLTLFWSQIWHCTSVNI